MEKVCFFTIADKNNERYAEMMLNSLRKFHPDVPHHLIGQEELDKNPDPQKFYRMYALVGKQLSKKYDLVINLDADSVVTGSLDHIINDDSYEVGAVLNNNLVDPQLTIFDVEARHYVNAGFIAARSKRFWAWWQKLNLSPYWEKHRYREQDMLNIIFHYGDLKTKIFDFSSKWHGLVHKGQWDKFVLRGDKIFLPKTERVCGEDKEIKIIHWAGGNVPKMNFHVHFKPKIVERLEWLTK